MGGEMKWFLFGCLFLCGCDYPEDPQLRTIAESNGSLVLTDANSNRYSARHLNGESWDLRRVKAPTP